MIHVNDVVYAKLTKKGAFLVNEQNRELMYRFPQQKLKVTYKSDEWYEQYLWVLFRHFGPDFTLGREPPFTEIALSPRTKPLESVTPPMEYQQ